jgi:hypothetical protein
MGANCPVVRETDDLQRMLDGLRQRDGGESINSPVIAVVRPDATFRSGQRIVGLVTPENINELVMIRGASQRQATTGHERGGDGRAG